MRVVCLSDTHGLHDAIRVPDGDVLVHAGDLTDTGTLDQVAEFAAWFAGLPHPVKVVIAGNHDFAFERDPERARSRLLGYGLSIVYLQDEALTLPGGTTIYGSPWQPRFFDWAFNLNRGAPLAAKWSLIPDDVDILITHGPPLGILDRNTSDEATGCEALAGRLPRLARLKLHVFGHIHEARGVVERDGVVHVNASSLDASYRPWDGDPIVVDL